MNANRPSKTSAPNRESPYLAFKDDRYRLLALVAREIKTLGITAMLVFGPVATSKVLGLLSLFGLK